MAHIMKKKNNSFLKFLIFSLVLVVIANIALLMFTRTVPLTGAFIKFDDSAAAWKVNPNSEDLPDDQKLIAFGQLSKDTRQSLREAIPSEIRRSASKREKYLKLVTWTRGQATKIASEISADSPVGVLEEMRSGRGATCGSFVQLYLGAARSLGLPARFIQLMRNPPFDSGDTHVVAEVFLDGRWVVVDPTFNTYYTLGQRMASAAELKDNLLKPLAKQQPVNVVYIDNTKFEETQVDTYYVNPNTLYSHVIIRGQRPSSSGFAERVSRRIPIIRSIAGFEPIQFAYEAPVASPFGFLNYLHLISYIILPSIIYCLGISLGLLIIFRRLRG